MSPIAERGEVHIMIDRDINFRMGWDANGQDAR